MLNKEEEKKETDKIEEQEIRNKDLKFFISLDEAES